VSESSRPFSPLLREIFDRMPAGVAVFDRELRLVEWNGSFSTFLTTNYPELERLLRPGVSIEEISPFDAGRTLALFKSALAGESISRDGVPLDGPNGRTYWDIALSPLYEHGEVVGVLDTTSNATRRVLAAREAQEREDLFRLVFDATSDAVILNDFETGLVAEANPAAAAMHGYTREEFVGIDPTAFIHTDSLPLFAEYQASVRAGKSYRARAQDVRKDGTVFDIEVQGSHLEYQGKRYLAAVVRDISDQVEAERQRGIATELMREAQGNLERRVEERTRELASLLDVSRAVLSTLNLDEIFERVLDEVAKVIPYSGCSVNILDGEHLEVIATRSLFAPELARRAQGLRFRVSNAPEMWRTILSGQPVIVDDSTAGTGTAAGLRALVGARMEANLEQIRSWLLAPMIHQGEVLGVLSISRASPNGFETAHAELAAAFAGQVAVAVANARLYQQSLRRAREMEGLASIAGALTVEMPAEEALNVLAGRVVAASSAVACSLTLYSDSSEFQAAGCAGLPRSFIDGVIHSVLLGAPSVTGLAASTGRRQILRNTRAATLADERFSEVHDYLRGAPWDTAVITPVSTRGRILGTLDAYYPAESEPDAEELRLLAAIADQLAIGFENSRLFDQSRRRMLEMDALYRAAERFHQSLVLDDVLRALAESALDVIGADRAVALVFDDAPPFELKVGAAAGMADNELSDLAEALREVETADFLGLSTPRFAQDAAAEPAAVQGIVRAAGIASVIDVPITVAGKNFGLFGVGWVERHNIVEAEVRLATALGQQAAVAIENARLYERAQLAASLEERQRLARELHDSVSQALYGISLGTRTARTLVERDPAKAVEPLDYVSSLAEAGLAELRALIFELRPESLATEGLVAALEKQFAALKARHGISVAADLCLEPDLRLDLKEVLYRVGQEALHNTVKHAKASRVVVQLSSEGASIALRITDDGVGFDASADYPGHLGLRSMAERTARASGTITVASQPGSGTAIEVTVPAVPGHLPGGAPAN
jgi:PAS domain S-box-containing protein